MTKKLRPPEVPGIVFMLRNYGGRRVLFRDYGEALKELKLRLLKLSKFIFIEKSRIL